nr:hypothetical protein [Sphingomonas sp. Ant H11]
MTEVIGGDLKVGDKVITGQLATGATAPGSSKRKGNGGQSGGQ